MRPESINENDLLALVEGRLSAERAERVRAALAQDPRLIRRVQTMIEDRSELAALLAQDLQRAPGGLVRDAISIAERDGLLVERPAAPKVKRTGAWTMPRPMAAAIALAGVVGLLAGAAVLTISLNSNLQERLVTESTPEHRFDVLEEPQEPIDQEDFLANLPALAQQGSVEERFADRLRPAAGDPIDESSAGDSVGDRSALVGPPAPSPDGAGVNQDPLWVDRIEPGANFDSDMNLEALARLAIAGRLELVVPSTSPDSWVEGAERKMALAGRLRPREPNRAERRRLERGTRTLSIEITVPWDPELLALQDELLRLQMRSARHSGPRVQASYRMFSDDPKPGAAPDPDPAAEAGDVLAGTLPSREVQHVLWWTTPPSSWRRHISVRVPMTIVPIEDDEAAPAPIGAR